MTGKENPNSKKRSLRIFIAKTFFCIASFAIDIFIYLFVLCKCSVLNALNWKEIRNPEKLEEYSAR